MNDPLIPLGVGGWFRRVGAVVGRGWAPLLVFQLVLAVWGVLFSFTVAGFVQGMDARAGAGPGEAAQPPPGLFALIVPVAGVGLLGAVLYSLLLSASVFLVIRAAAGLPATITGALRFGATPTLALLG